MAAVTGAIWKCATNNPPNVERFQELELMNILIQLLRDNSDALDDLQFNPQKMSVLTNGTDEKIYLIFNREHRSRGSRNYFDDVSNIS